MSKLLPHQESRLVYDVHLENYMSLVCYTILGINKSKLLITLTSEY